MSRLVRCTSTCVYSRSLFLDTLCSTQHSLQYFFHPACAQTTGFFYETVAPLLCIGNTSFIAISTLTSEMNFYTVGFCALMAVNRRTSKHMIFDDGLSKAMLMSPKLFLRRNSSPKSTNSPISQSSSPSRSLWHAKRASMPRKHTNGVCKVSAA